MRSIGFVLAVAATLAASARAAPVLTRLNPTIGGFGGGVKLTITGYGFGDNFGGANQVFIGDAECKIETFYSTQTQIVCMTPEMDQSSLGNDVYLPVRVVVNGVEQSTCGIGNCNFRYHYGYNPEIRGVRTPFVRDEGFIDVQARVWWFDKVERFEWRFGDQNQMCDMLVEGGDRDEFVLMDQRSDWGYLRCRPDDVPAGYYNTSLTIVDPNNRGTAVSTAAARQVIGPDMEDLHHTVVVPVVHSVVPSIGSIAGGTELTISGVNFQHGNFGGDIHRNRVMVGAVPCTVTSATSTEIKCITGPQGPPNPLKGDDDDWRLYEGEFGAVVETYENIDSWWIHNNGGGIHEYAKTHAPTTVNQEDFLESAQSYGNYYGARHSTIFTAPKTGLYRWLVSGDDRGDLWVSTDENPANLRRVAYLGSHTGFRNWAHYYNNGEDVWMESGKRYFVEMNFLEFGGGDHATGGFMFVGDVHHEFRPSVTSRSISAQQRLRSQATRRYQVQTVTVSEAVGGVFTLQTNGAATAPLAWNESASAVGDAVDSLFDVPCIVSQPESIQFYDLDTFEPGRSSDSWHSRNGINPRNTRTSFCGRNGQHHYDGTNGGGWGRNFEGGSGLEEGQTSSGYDLRLFPHICFAYRVPENTKVNLLIRTNKFSWNSIRMTFPAELDKISYKYVADFNVIADNRWHHNCVNLFEGYDNTRGSGVGDRLPNDLRVTGIIFHTPRYTSDVQGELWIDEFAVASEPRFVERAPGFEDVNNELVHDPWNGMAVSSVSVSRSVSDATSVYSITFVPTTSNLCSVNAPTLIATASADASVRNSTAPTVSVSVSAASEPLSGYILASVRGSRTVKFSQDQSIKQLAAAVADWRTVGTGTSILRTVNSCWDRYYNIYFNGASGFVDLVDFDDTALHGYEKNTWAIHLRQGGLLAFPLPGNLMRTPVRGESFHVEVNGVHGSTGCNYNVSLPFNGCGFRYDLSVTPKVTSVSPASGGPGTLLTLRGNHLDARSNVVIQIGGAPCAVGAIAADGTSLSCTLGNSRGGDAEVTVSFPGYGNADTTALVAQAFTADFSVSSSSPVQGSLNGGLTLQILGAGFSQASADHVGPDHGLTVTIVTTVTTNSSSPSAGNTHTLRAACVVTSVSYSAILCSVPSIADAVNGNGIAIDVWAGSFAVAGRSDIAVSLEGKNGTTSTGTLTSAFLYSASTTPSILSVAPTSLRAFGNEVLTVTGSAFGRETNNVSVTIGGRTCLVSSVSDSTIDCRTPPLPAGDHSVIVGVSPHGSARPACAHCAIVTSSMDIASFSVVSDVDGNNAIAAAGPGQLVLSMEGGALVEIVGSGFGTPNTTSAAAVAAGLERAGTKVVLTRRTPDEQIVTVVATPFDTTKAEHDPVVDVQRITLAGDNVQHAVWSVVLTQGESPGGRFSLSVNNVSAPAVRFNATAEEIAAAVEATGATELANVTSYRDVGSTVWDITFAGMPEDVGSLELTDLDLAPGSSLSAAEVQKGVERFAGAYRLLLTDVSSGPSELIGIDASREAVISALVALPGRTFDVFNVTVDRRAVPGMVAASAVAIEITIALTPHPRAGDLHGRIPVFGADMSSLSGLVHPFDAVHVVEGQAGHRPLSGSFKLALGGQSTAALAHDIAAAELSTALAGLDGVDIVSVTRSVHAGGSSNGNGFGAVAGYGYGNTALLGGAGQGYTWTVTFWNSHKGILSADSSGLGGTEATAAAGRLRTPIDAKYEADILVHEDTRIVARTPAIAVIDNGYADSVISRSGASGPVGYWRLDDPAGGGASNAGSLGALADLEVPSQHRARTGYLGMSRRNPSFGLGVGVYGLGDEDRYLNYTGARVGHRSGLNSPTFSVETWVRFESLDFDVSSPILSNAHVVGVSADQGSEGYMIWVNPCGKIELWIGNGNASQSGLISAATTSCSDHEAARSNHEFPWTALTSATSVQPRRWYHIAAQYDAGRQRAALIVNGIVEATKANVPFSPNRLGDLVVGGLPLCEEADKSLCPLLGSTGNAGQPAITNATFDEVALFDIIVHAYAIRSRAFWDADALVELGVVSAGVAAACSDSAASCMAAYSASATPVIRFVGPQDGYYTTVVTIVGGGFSSVMEENTVMIGSVPCRVSSATSTEIVCTAGNAENGRYPVSVFVRGSGNAASYHTFSYIVVINTFEQGGVTPNQGSLAGGTVVSISGFGFHTNPDWNVVHVRNITYPELKIHHLTRCKAIQPTNRNTITCVMPPALEYYSGNLTLSVGDPSKPDFASLAEFRSAACAFIFRPHTSPFLSEVVPNTGVAGDIITIRGSGFSTAVADMSVAFGGTECTVQSSSANELTCELQEGPGGTHDVEVVVGGALNYGRAMGPWLFDQGPSPFGIDSDTLALGRVIEHDHPAALAPEHEGVTYRKDPQFANRTFLLFHHDSSITSISRSAVSVGGGESVTLSGIGLGDSLDDPVVMFGLSRCDPTHVNYTTIICTVEPPLPILHDFSAVDSAGGTEPTNAAGFPVNENTTSSWLPFLESLDGGKPQWNFQRGALYQNANAYASGGNRETWMLGAALIYAPSHAGWQDYTVSARMLSDSDYGTTGVFLRATFDDTVDREVASSYYRVSLYPRGNLLQLHRVNAGTHTRLFSASVLIQHDNWNRVAVTASEFDLTIFYNGHVVGSVHDNSPDALTSGRAGVWTYGSSSPKVFDDFSVKFGVNAGHFPQMPNSGIGELRVSVGGLQSKCTASTTVELLPPIPGAPTYYNSTFNATSNITTVHPAQVAAPVVEAGQDCQVQLHPLLTPRFRTIEVSTGVDGLVGAGDVLHLHGEGFASSALVQVGDAQCDMLFASSTLLECLLPHLGGGHHPIRVFVPGAGSSLPWMGTSARPEPVVEYDLILEEITPEQSGFGGGVQASITGLGFPPSQQSMLVSACGKSCRVVETQPDSFNCSLPPIREFDPTAEPTTVVRVRLDKTSSMDDAFEVDYGRVFPDHVNAPMYGTYINGWRFKQVQVPSNAVIKSAVLRLTSRTRQSGKSYLHLYADRRGKPSDPRSTWFDISRRPKTNATVLWEMEEFRMGGQQVESSDLKSIINEVIAQPDWQQGNDMYLIAEQAPGYAQRNKDPATIEYALTTGTDADLPVLEIEYYRRSSSQVWSGLSDEEECDVEVVLRDAPMPAKTCLLPTPSNAIPNDNIALGKPAFATSVRHTHEAAEFATDEHSGTIWRGNGWNGADQIITVDLEGRFAVQMVELYWWRRPWDYLIETSLDGTEWEAIKTSPMSTSQRYWYLGTDSAPTVDARFVRVRITHGQTSTTYGLRSLYAYGCESRSVFESSTLNITDAAPNNGRRLMGNGNANAKLSKKKKKVKYNKFATPVVTGVSPHRGSTAGGSTITIAGTGFSTKKKEVSVSIDGVDCAVLSSSVTSVTCLTGTHRTTDRMPVVVTTKHGGASAPELDAWYQYIDLWSAKTTWGGLDPPIEGDSVSIPPGQTVLLDVSPPRLFAILIQGSLIFDDSSDLYLDAHYIMVNGGKFQVGTEDEPFMHRAQITLHGHPRQLWLPIYGTKVIGVRNGVLDLHGAPTTRTWTRLASTMEVNSTIAVLQDPVDWPMGAEIIITTTDYKKEHTEQARIASIDSTGRILTLEARVAVQHLGETRQVSAEHSLEVRAEVALLSHNVVVQGDPTTEQWQFGGTVMMHSHGSDSVIGRISDCEFRQMGQAFTLGKYPIHWHMIGNVKRSYAKRNSVHHTYNRAITIHGVHHLRLLENVAYYTMGHTFFIEDAIETKNVIEGNLGAMTQPARALLNTDQSPATFWVTNPDNYVRNNVAAGSSNYGFWYRAEPRVTGAAASAGMGDNVCPQGTPLGEFSGNTAHSNGRYGLRIFDVYTPREDPCNGNSALVQANFTGLLTYRNGKNGVTVTVSSAVVLDDFTVADNKIAGFEMSSSQGGFTGGEWIATAHTDTSLSMSRIDRATVIGASGDDVHLGGLQLGLRGPADHGLTVSDTDFINFDAGERYAIGACTKCNPFALKGGGWEVRFQRIRYFNVPQRTHWRWVHEGTYYDMDGTMSGTGVPGTSVVSASPFPVAMPNCFHDERYDGGPGGRVCTNQRFVRYAMNNVRPTSKKFKKLNVTWLRGAEGDVQDKRPFLKKGRTNAEGWQLTLPVNNTFQMNVDVTESQKADLTKFSFHIGEFLKGEWIDFKTKLSQVPDHIELGGKMGKQFMGPIPADAPSGSWWWDEEDYYANYKFAARTYATSRNSWAGSWDNWACPRSGCPIPAAPGMPLGDGVLRRWSDPETWDFIGVDIPNDGDDVVIPQNVLVLLDVSTPILAKLEVFGTLFFDPDKPDTELELRAHIILVYGWLSAGEPGLPFENRATITLYGDKDYPGALVHDSNVGSKLLAVMGTLRLAGRERLHTHTTLSRTAEAGATEIVVHSKTSWGEGSTVSIASTDFEPANTEDRVIVSEVWDDVSRTSTITFSDPLQHTHLGITEIHGGKSIDMYAEVAVLDSNVRVRAGNAPGRGAIEQEDHGCMVKALKTRMTQHNFDTNTDELVWKIGAVALSDVEFQQCGQNGADRGYALEFSKQGDRSNTDEKLAMVQRCMFHDGHGKGIAVHDGSHGVRLRDNVIHKTIGTSIFIDGNDNELVNNVVVFTRATAAWRPPTPNEWKISTWLDPSFEIMGMRNIVQRNRAAGSERAGFKMDGEECIGWRDGLDEEITRVSGNVAHSSGFGMWVNDMGGTSFRCVQVVDLTAYANWEYGLLGWPPTSWRVSNYRAADNSIGFMLNSFRPGSLSHRLDTDRELQVDDALVVGISSSTGKDCSEPMPENVYLWAHRKRIGDPGRRGMTLATINGGGRKPLKKGPPSGGMSYPALAGRTVVKNTVFANFQPSCNKENHVVHSNQAAEDFLHPTYFEAITWVNVAESSKVQLLNPGPGKINEADCIDMSCDGHKQVLITDVDGSFLGGRGGSAIFGRAERFIAQEVGAIIPTGFLVSVDGQPVSESDIAVDRGIPRPVGCSMSEDWNGWQCDNDFTYRVSIIESLDSDTEIRRLSPVGVLSGGAMNVDGDTRGYMNLLNGPQDHGWCFGYTCQKRISTFWGVVATPESYRVVFTSSPPQQLRLTLLDAEPDDAVVYNFWYPSPQRLEVYVGGVFIEDLNYDGTSHKSANNPAYQDVRPSATSPNGANAYFRLRREIEVTVRGAAPVTIITVPVVQVSLTLAVDLDSFFDIQDQFVSNVAFVLNIDPSRIRVVDVVPGSVNVDFEIAPERVNCSIPANFGHEQCPMLITDDDGPMSASGSASASSGSSSVATDDAGDDPTDTDGASDGSDAVLDDYTTNYDDFGLYDEEDPLALAGVGTMNSDALFQELVTLQTTLVESALDGSLSAAIAMDLEAMDVVPPPPPPVELTVDPELVRPTNDTAPAPVVVEPPTVIVLRRGTFVFSDAVFVVSEGTPHAIVTVDRNDGTFGSVTVDIESVAMVPRGDAYSAAGSPNLAEAGVDYVPLAKQTLVFPPYQRSMDVSVPLLDDLLFEVPSEAFAVRLSNPTNDADLGELSTAMVLIDNDDTPSVMQFAAETVTVDAGTTVVSVEITRSGNLLGPASVQVSTVDGSAIAGTHYTAVSAHHFSYADGVTTAPVLEVAIDAGAADVQFEVRMHTAVNSVAHVEVKHVVVLPIANSTSGQQAVALPNGLGTGATIGIVAAVVFASVGVCIAVAWSDRQKKEKRRSVVTKGVTGVNEVGIAMQTRGKDDTAAASNWGRSPAKLKKAASSEKPHLPLGGGTLDPLRPGAANPLPALSGSTNKATIRADGSFGFEQTPEMRNALRVASAK